MKFDSANCKFLKTVIFSGYTFSFAAIAEEDGSHDNIFYTFCDTDAENNEYEEENSSNSASGEKQEAVEEKRRGDSEKNKEMEDTEKQTISEGDHTSYIDSNWTPLVSIDFPNEIRPVGMSLLTQPVFDQNKRIATSSYVAAQQPFEVIVDNINIWIIRRFATAPAGMPQHPGLLADRFIFDSGAKRLVKANEVRFVRSGHPDLPATDRDTYGSSDLDGSAFVEPTFLIPLDIAISPEDSFAALLIPDSNNSKRAIWHFFLTDSSSGNLRHYTVPYTEFAWFDLTDMPSGQIADDGAICALDILKASTTTDSALILSYPAATCYEQQETAFTQIGEMQKVKRSVRAMLACHAASDNETVLAAFDFGIGINGKFANIQQDKTLKVSQVDRYNAALKLDGRNDFVTMRNKGSVAIDNFFFTASCWIRWDGTANSSAMQTVFTLIGNFQSCCIQIDNYGRLYFQSGTNTKSSSVVLVPKQWTVLTLAFIPNHPVNLYVNSQLAISTDSFSGAISDSVTPLLGAFTDDITFVDDYSQYFNGAFGKFLLSTSSSALSGNMIDDVECLISWEFNKGYGTTIDNSGTASKYPDYSGVITGATWEPDVCPSRSSMPVVYFDSNMLDIRAILLNPSDSDSIAAEPASDSAPSFMNGGDGMLHLYFRDQSNHASVLHMSTSSERERILLFQEIGIENIFMLTLVAKQPGRDKTTSLSIAGLSNDKKEFTLVTLRRGEYKEEWQNIPTRLDLFAQVINGNAAIPDSDLINNEFGKVTYDYANNVLVNGQSLTSGGVFASQLFEAVPNKKLLDQNPIPSFTSIPKQNHYIGKDCGWIMEPLQPCISTLTGAYRIAADAPALNIPGNLTLQCWFFYRSGTGTKIVSFYDENETAYIMRINYDSEYSETSFTLVATRYFVSRADSKADIIMRSAIVPLPISSWKHFAAVYNSSFGLHLPSNVYVNCGNSESLNITDAITIEAWVNLDSNQDSITNQIISKESYEINKSSYGLKIITIKKSKRNICLDVWNDNGELPSHIFEIQNFKSGVWNHIAATYRPCRQLNYLAFEEDRQNYVELGSLTNEPMRTFTAEMLFRTRDANTVHAYLSLNSTTSPNNYFVFRQNSNNQLEVVIADNQHEISKDSWNADDKKWSFVSIVVETRESATSSGYWATYLTVYVDGEIACQENKLNDVLGQLSSSDTKPWMIGAEWDINGSGHGTISDYIDADVAEVRIWSTARTQEEILSTLNLPLTGGESGLVAYVIFNEEPGSTQNTVVNRVNNESCNINDSDSENTPPPALGWASYVVEGKSCLYFNGALIDTRTYAGAEKQSIRSTDTRVTLGCKAAALNESENHFDGALDNVRLWRCALLPAQLLYFSTNPIPDPARQPGLAAFWAFNEGQGDRVKDSVSGESAKIVGMRFAQFQDADEFWVPNSIDADWTFYIDGIKVESDSRQVKKNQNFSQFGGLLLGKISGGDHLFSEVQIWNKARTGEEIFRTMKQPAIAPVEGLQGYYRLNDGSGLYAADSSGNAADVLSSSDGLWFSSYNVQNQEAQEQTPPVPIRDEAGYIINISNNYKSPEANALKITSAPSVAEDHLSMNRIYSYLSNSGNTSNNGKPVFKADVPLAETELVYIGQIQYKPRLIGFIEGAPPVPSENLTVDSPGTPDKYDGNASVTLNRSETATISASAGVNGGLGFAANIKAGLGLRADVSNNIGTWVGVGVGGWTGVDTPLLNVNVNAYQQDTLAANSEVNYQQQADLVETTTKSFSVFFSGGWENNCYKIPGDISNPYFIAGERLYRSDNMGAAIVKSRTADLYAVRSKKTKFMLGYQAVPNPEIPEDINTLMFKINPKYVKNGSIDGYIGFDPDIDYMTLEGNRKGSFCKPEQAYRLKKSIEREARNAASDIYQSNPIGGLSATHDQFTRLSLVNTYVWNADGSFLSLESQFSTSYQEIFSGGFDLAGSIDFGLSGDIYGGYGVLAGFSGSCDLLGSFKLNLNYSHEDGKTMAVSLDTNVIGEGFINRVLVAPAIPDYNDTDGSAVAGLNAGSISSSLNNWILQNGITLTSKSHVARQPQSAASGPWLLVDLYIRYKISLNGQVLSFEYFPVSSDRGQNNVNYDFSSPPCPGKVRSYRFMSFYLAPSKSNFNAFFAQGDEQIIDPVWLQSADPDAVALRQAANIENEVWRVLHRVTYVSRFPLSAQDVWSGENSPPQTEDVANSPLRPDDHSIRHNSFIVRSVLNAVMQQKFPGSTLEDLEEFDFTTIDLNNADILSLVESSITSLLTTMNITGTAQRIYFDELLDFFEILLSPNERPQAA